MNSVATLVVWTAFLTAGILMLACISAAIKNRPSKARKPKATESQFPTVHEKRVLFKEALHQSPSLASSN